jgi:hypothetical protein
MKNAVFKAFIFLCFPAVILICAIAHHEPAFEGKEIPVWFSEIKVGHPSPALAAFQKMGSAAVPVLQTELKSQDAGSRIKAAWVLGQLGPVASNAIPDLLQSLDNPVNNLPIFALQSLETIAPAQVDDVSKLLSELCSTNIGVCNCAADLLDKIEQARKAANLPQYGDAYENAMVFLRSPAGRVRSMGVGRLIRLSPDDKRALTTLKSLLNDPDTVVRQQSVAFFNGPYRILLLRRAALSGTNS